MKSTEFPWRIPAALTLLWLAAGVSLALALSGPARVALPGCADGAPGCAALLTSGYASIFGVPAGWVGVTVFLLLVLTSGAFARREPTVAAVLGGTLAGAVLGGAAWFVTVQAVLLKQWCPWCLTAHAAGTVAVALLMLERRSRPVAERAGPRWMPALTAAGLVASALVAVGSAWRSGALGGGGGAGVSVGADAGVGQEIAESIPQPGPLPGGNPWSLDVGSHTMNLDLSLFPAAGVKDASRTAFLLTDYTCAHCRGYGPFVEEVASDQDQPVRLMLLPAARDAEGAAIHRVLLTLFYADPAAWRVLHGQLLSGSVPPRAEEVCLAARTALGETGWHDACAAHAKSADLAMSTARAIQAESRRRFPDSMLPQLLAGSEVLMGAEGDRNRLNEFLAANANANATPPAGTPGPSPPARSAPPALALLRPDYPLGNLPATSRADVTLQLMNPGPQSLPVPRLELPDGCLVTAFPVGDVPATSGAEIKVACTVPHATGSFQKFIVLHTPHAALTARLHGTSESGDTTVAAQPESAPVPHVPVP
ncbi:MAG: hypothetical protein JWL81_2554 [Verrucomicrobiales bacterium]|nr:hypothetical protein [Verrucomicrobiales bacterium]